MTGNHIYPNAFGVLLRNRDSASIDNNDFTDASPNMYDVFIESSSSITGSFAGNKFAGFAGTILNETTENLDATGDTFNVGPAGAQVGGSNLSLAEGFAVENGIQDYLFIPAYGYVKINSGHVYVAHSSEAVTAGAVQRGVNVAVANDTVYVQPGAYAGNVTVTTGVTLELDGTITSNVDNSGTLDGTGTIIGNVSGYGIFHPGDAPGTMTINGNFTPTGTVNFEVNSPYAVAGTDYDQYIVSGTVDLSGATLTFTNHSDTMAPAANAC